MNTSRANEVIRNLDFIISYLIKSGASDANDCLADAVLYLADYKHLLIDMIAVAEFPLPPKAQEKQQTCDGCIHWQFNHSSAYCTKRKVDELGSPMSYTISSCGQGKDCDMFRRGGSAE